MAPLSKANSSLVALCLVTELDKACAVDFYGLSSRHWAQAIQLLTIQSFRDAQHQRHAAKRSKKPTVWCEMQEWWQVRVRWRVQLRPSKPRHTISLMMDGTWALLGQVKEPDLSDEREGVTLLLRHVERDPSKPLLWVLKFMWESSLHYKWQSVSEVTQTLVLTDCLTFQAIFLSTNVTQNIVYDLTWFVKYQKKCVELVSLWSTENNQLGADPSHYCKKISMSGLIECGSLIQFCNFLYDAQ